MLIEAGLTLAVLGLVAKAANDYRRRHMTTSTSQVTIANRVMRGPTGATYTLTDDDLLWLARAVNGETGTKARGGAAVVWALAQNFLLVGRRPPRMTPFSRLIRNYCQPVNAAWADPNGAKCRRSPSACTPDKIRRRALITNMAWDAIPASIRTLVTNFAAGTVPNPIPGLTDWATPRWGADNIEIDGNFFGRNTSRTYVA
jgi:hypothetical protein